MALTRGQLILSRVKLSLGEFDNNKFNDDLVFYMADQITRDIAEESLSIEKSASLAVVANTADYDLTLLTPSGGNAGCFYRLKLIELPQSVKLQPIEIDVVTYDQLKRLFFTSSSSSAYVQIFFKIYNGTTLSFFPFPQSNQTYTIWFYALPTTNISKTVAPEVPQEFDRAISYGVIAELAPQLGKPDVAQAFSEKYANEYTRAYGAWRRVKSYPNQIAYTDF